MKLSIVLVALLAVGCVPRSKYESLQRQLGDTQDSLTKQIQERDARCKELAAQIAAKDTELATAKTHAQDNAGELARLEAARARLEAELAATVRDKAALKASAEELGSALADSNKRKAEAERRLAEFRKLLGQLKAMIDAGKLKVRMVDGRMVLALASDVLFPSGSAELSPPGLQTINEVATVLSTIPDRRLQIEGHTDNVPIKTARFPSNWELGAARATTIVNAMIAAGIAPARLSAASYGEYRPAASNDTDQGRATNRRIEIVVVPDLSLLPGFDELQKAVEIH